MCSVIYENQHRRWPDECDGIGDKNECKEVF